MEQRSRRSVLKTGGALGVFGGLAGLGSLTGTLYAAYAIGFMQATAEVAIGTTWTLPVLYGAILLLLIVRPYGFKGSRTEARL